MRRHPVKPPAHALLERLDLPKRRPRNHRQPNITRRQMHHTAFNMVGNERATRAPFRPPRTEHEVIHNQLAFAAEKIGQRLLALRSIEDIGLLNPLPRQLATLLAQFVAKPRELLLFLQQLLARPAIRPATRLSMVSSRSLSCLILLSSLST